MKEPKNFSNKQRFRTLENVATQLYIRVITMEEALLKANNDIVDLQRKVTALTIKNEDQDGKE